MPQISLDYSSNIKQTVDISVLHSVNSFVAESIDCVVNSIKSRLIKIDDFLIGRGEKIDSKEQAFVTLWLHILPGRSDSDKTMLGNGLQKILQDYFAESLEDFALQIRIKIDEIDGEFYFM